MNILITAPNLDPNKNVSGISTITNEIIKNNKKQNYFHYLLGRKNNEKGKLIWLKNLLTQLLLFPTSVKKNNIDLVHQNLPFDTNGILREFIINCWCRILNVPVILHIHGGRFISKETINLIFKILVKSMFKYSKKVIVLSPQEQKMLQNVYGYKKALILPNGIDVTIYKPDTQKNLNKVPQFIYIGRIEKNKGIIDIIETFKLLVKEIRISFILCGTGPLTEYCIKECEKISFYNFEYKGVVFGSEKINCIKSSDFFILPSYFEGLPMALLETMACGVVPIVTNVGSINLVVEDKTNGIFIKVKNHHDIYVKLKSVLFNSEYYQKLSLNAINTINGNYDIKEYIYKLNKIYSDCFHDTK